MLFVFLLLFELILLFFLSRRVINSLYRLFFRLTKSQGVARTVVTLLFLPGTVIHELSHFLAATLLFVRTGEIRLLAQVEEGRVKTGTIEVAKTDPFRRLLIGLAPFFFGFALLTLAGFWYTKVFLSQDLGTLFSYKETYFLLYLFFQISNTMYSSREDLEGFLPVIFVLVVVTLAFYLSSLWLRFDFPNIFLPSPLPFFLVVLGAATLGLNLLILTLALLARFLLARFFPF